MRCLAVLFVLLLPALAPAQISVPANVAAHKPIVAKLSANLPPGAQLRGSWNVTGGDFLEADANAIHIWAGPGVHTVSANGIWVLTKTVTIDGQELQVLIDFGQYAYSAEFKVGGVVPPVPPPQPPGDRWAIIVEETSNRTPQLAALWLQLRKTPPASKLLILDKDHPAAAYKAYFSAAAAVPLPALVVVATDGSVVSAAPCPLTLEAIKAEVGK